MFLVCGGEIHGIIGEILFDFSLITKTSDEIECEWHIKNVPGSFVKIDFL